MMFTPESMCDQTSLIDIPPMEARRRNVQTPSLCLLTSGRLPNLSMKPLVECDEEDRGISPPFRNYDLVDEVERKLQFESTPSVAVPLPRVNDRQFAESMADVAEVAAVTTNRLDNLENTLMHFLSKSNNNPMPINLTNQPRKRDFMKPRRFNGTGSFESFLEQFEVCALHNKWTEQDRIDYFKNSLDDPVAQVLWDLGSSRVVPFQGLVDRLRQRYGKEGQAETFRTQLRCRRRRSTESLCDLMQDIRRLMVLAYPVADNEITEILARDFFLDALADRELSIKIREKEPTNLDQAFRIALRLEAYQLSDPDDYGEKFQREKKKVRVVKEEDGNVPTQWNAFVEQQRKLNEDWRRSMECQMQASLKSLPVVKDSGPWNQGAFGQPLHVPMVPTVSVPPIVPNLGASFVAPPYTPTVSVPSTPSIPVASSNGNVIPTCFKCGIVGHKSNRCPLLQSRRSYGNQSGANSSKTARSSDVPTSTITYSSSTPKTSRIMYVKARIMGYSRLCMIDTGSDVNLIPESYLPGVHFSPSERTLQAANGSPIKILGEASVPLKIGRRLTLPTTFVVSDQVTDVLLGIQWLHDHRCRMEFGTGSIFIARQKIALVHRNGNECCRRVTIAETTTIPARMEQNLEVKLLYRNHKVIADGWMTDSREIQPGIRVARIILPDLVSHVCVRVMNVSNHPVTLQKDLLVSDLHPIPSIAREDASADSNIPFYEDLEKVIAGIPDDVSPEQRDHLINLVMEFQDVFSRDEFDLGETKIVQHRIETGDSAPIRQPLRRQPLLQAQEIDKHTEKLLKAGIIEPASGEYASNVVLVRKKDGSLRFCLDFRALNLSTRRDAYPLPRIDDCLDSLSGATWYSTLDLRAGYHQVSVYPPDADKTSFLTRRGIFRFRKMPFGLCNAPATFQRLMDVVLAGLSYEICLVYLDDIIIFSTDIDTHLIRLRTIFERLRQSNLKLKPSKCSLLRQKVCFLGYIVSKDGISADPKKVESILSWPTPIRLREVRAFLGLCSYYRKFCRSFAEIAAPLHALTQKNRKFEWTLECQNAFDRLKLMLSSAPVLTLPNDTGSYRLDVDASDHGIGAVLSQFQDGQEKVIAYASRLYSQQEARYCVTRKELLSAVHFTKVFRQYLLGRPFVLRTDHSALQWLRRTPEPIGQQSRWLERLEEFDYSVEHRAGRHHENADAMSRRPCRQCGYCMDPVQPASVSMIQTATEEVSFDPEHLSAKQATDPDLAQIYRAKATDNVQPAWNEMLKCGERTRTYWHQWESLELVDGVLYRTTPEGDRLVIMPRDLRELFLQKIHTDMTNGHLGTRRTRFQVRRRAYWVGWSQDVKRFCQRCLECNQYHRGGPPRQGLLQPIPVGEPWDRVSLDITGPHPKSSNGKVYILTIIDQFTKYVESAALPNQEAKTVAKAFMEHVILRHGAPLQILTDRGTNFESALFRELCILMKTDKVRTTAYEPRTNGMLERFHRTLNSILAKLVATNQRDWPEHLPYALAAYRATVHESTNFSPNYLLYGHEIRAPVDLMLGRPTEDEGQRPLYHEFVEDVSRKMETSYRLVRENLRKAAETRKKRYDLRVKRKEFQQGDWVFYYSPRKFIGRSPKWTKMYSGPFLVIAVHGPVNYELQRGPRAKPFMAHVDKMRHFYGSTPASWIGDPDVPVIPLLPVPESAALLNSAPSLSPVDVSPFLPRRSERLRHSAAANKN